MNTSQDVGSFLTQKHFTTPHKKYKICRFGEIHKYTVAAGVPPPLSLVAHRVRHFDSSPPQKQPDPHTHTPEVWTKISDFPPMQLWCGRVETGAPAAPTYLACVETGDGGILTISLTIRLPTAHCATHQPPTPLYFVLWNAFIKQCSQHLSPHPTFSFGSTMQLLCRPPQSVKFCATDFLQLGNLGNIVLASKLWYLLTPIGRSLGVLILA